MTQSRSRVKTLSVAYCIQTTCAPDTVFLTDSTAFTLHRCALNPSEKPSHFCTEALWAAQGPLAILSHRDDPQSARLVDARPPVQLQLQLWGSRERWWSAFR